MALLLCLLPVFMAKWVSNGVWGQVKFTIPLQTGSAL
jgi:hypothetical protein